MEGPDSAQFRNTLTKIVEDLNKTAMQYVQHNDIETGMNILTYCEQVTDPNLYGSFPMLRNLTYNNIGCVCRRTGKLKMAIHHLKNALAVLINNGLQKFSAMTYLNLCAVLSQMGE